MPSSFFSGIDIFTRSDLEQLLSNDFAADPNAGALANSSFTAIQEPAVVPTQTVVPLTVAAAEVGGLAVQSLPLVTDVPIISPTTIDNVVDGFGVQLTNVSTSTGISRFIILGGVGVLGLAVLTQIVR